MPESQNGGPKPRVLAAQIVKAVEQILYAVDAQEAKSIIADAQRDPYQFTTDAASL